MPRKPEPWRRSESTIWARNRRDKVSVMDESARILRVQRSQASTEAVRLWRERTELLGRQNGPKRPSERLPGASGYGGTGPSC